MSDDRNNERTPLIQIGRQIEPKNCRDTFCSCLCIVLLIGTIVVLSFTGETPELDLPVDISQIPKAYQLRPNRYFYVIESLPVEFDSITNDSITNYTSTTNSMDNFEKESFYEPGGVFKIAEIIPIPKFWTSGLYEIREFRYLPDGNATMVSTVISKFEGFWTNSVKIQFTAAYNESLDPSVLENCEYKVIRNFFLNGFIQRRCPHEEEFYEVAFVQGAFLSEWKFLSLNKSVEFGEISKMDVWNNKRDVTVYEYAPYPPIIPAIYAVYRDLLESGFKAYVNTR
ncbi:25667_t:CDS:2 [Dentiscutata erythropus]|uniref:25667_t:CDS:1 n=1 Tax=Dentiscutata erythropus TaxID=1348616 RepID=A0A9N9I8F6_9GLOM|nr:25667_t:CDS:2 [Dentiscutata erythropus]